MCVCVCVCVRAHVDSMSSVSVCVLTHMWVLSMDLFVYLCMHVGWREVCVCVCVLGVKEGEKNERID